LPRNSKKFRIANGLNFCPARNGAPHEALTIETTTRKEDGMRKLVLALAAGAALVAAVPASAQVYFGADPGGAGVQVGPFGAGVGPRYDGWRGDYGPEYRAYGQAYEPGCRVTRERIETPSGRVIFQSRRVCR
jgi:hypothetical protein